MDDWTREEYDLASLAAGLRREEGEQEGARDLLPMGESLPRAFEEVFEDLEREVVGLWRLSEGMEEEVRALRERVGLGGERWEVERESASEGGGGRGWSREKRGEGRGPVIGSVVLSWEGRWWWA